MKKKLFFSLLSAALSLLPLQVSAKAECPFTMPDVAQPKIPKYEVSVTDFGGVGDGGTLNTEAFAKAMKALSDKGGGRLNVPSGIWLTGPIQFENNCELHVKRGALVLFTTDFDAYPEVTVVFEGKSAKRRMSPLWAYEKHDVAITGHGSFDGQGEHWRPSKKGKFTTNQWKELTSGDGIEQNNIWYPNAKNDDQKGKPGAPDLRRVNGRPTLLEFTRCKRVLLKDITLSNSPSWNTHPLMCEDFTMDGVTVRNPWYAQNGDGLDLESANRAIIRDCVFDVGDDAICIKSGKDAEGRSWKKPCQNVIIEDCTVLHGHGGFVIGSEMSSGARNIWVHNCVFNGTDTGLRMKSTRGRGGVVEKIYIEKINMVNIAGDAFTLDLYYANKPATGKADADSDKSGDVQPVTEETPSFRDIHISKVVCQGAGRAIWINGLPEMPLSNLTMKNCLFVAKKGAELHYAKDINFKQVTITNSVGDAISTDATVKGFKTTK
ncbi:MAG: glycoside hydrolase family 28 protein [Bacteroidales bacterium]|nr:glycoside hydrolase family 28 protein [Bacteroidales bacterium]